MASTFPLHAAQALGYHVDTAQLLLRQTYENAAV